jgi:hypothetical protein
MKNFRKLVKLGFSIITLEFFFPKLLYTKMITVRNWSLAYQKTIRKNRYTMFRTRIKWEFGEKLKKNHENEKGEKNKIEKHDVKKRWNGS